MSHPYTDEFGFPLRSTTVLRRKRAGRPIYTGAIERAGFNPMPATVHQIAEELEREKESDDAGRPN